MKKYVLAAALAAASAMPAYAQTTVNFDTSTNPASYTAQGLVLNGFTIQSNTFGGAVSTPSQPNYATVNLGGGSIRFVDPTTGAPTTSNGFGITSSGLNLGGGYFAGATLNFLTLGGALLGSQTFSPAGPNELRTAFQYANNFANIGLVTFTRIENANGPALAPFDNVTFSLNAATGAVPEPATWGMMILGFGAMGYAMRRRAKVRTNVSFG